jgi:hypothetical protein
LFTIPDLNVHFFNHTHQWPPSGKFSETRSRAIGTDNEGIKSINDFINLFLFSSFCSDDYYPGDSGGRGRAIIAAAKTVHQGQPVGYKSSLHLIKVIKAKNFFPASVLGLLRSKIQVDSSFGFS